ncbi:fatty acid desaturase family protein [Brachybacterium subflavum]|uniref:fatty acid desaturase family protein n=1 Tax=Brachybacterium subflavum TaxID=2585206 RepID=UPI00126669AB|nr:acyl-CoA desaturase [Brachybacterium subflavum]
MVTRPLEQSSTLSTTHLDAESFPPQLRAFMEVSKDVKAAGLLHRARWYYALVGAAVLVLLGVCVVAFLLLGSSWFQLIVAGALGVAFTQIAFIGHEAGHRQVLAGGTANTHLARVLAGIVGLSYTWWDSKHSRHHANPNKVGKDPDVAVDTISFLPEDAARARGLQRWITRRQGWLFFPLLTLEGLNLHLHSFRHLLFTPKVKHRPSELALLTARFVAIAAPVFLLLPLGMAFAFLGVQFAVFGVYMGASFAPNHKGMPVIARGARLDFFSKQVRTSRNIQGGWWATALLGGLNYQVEHHLFPSMPRIHLSKAREIVRAKCAALNVPYTEVPLHRSYMIVVRYLNDVGLAARDPFECPVLAQYRT